MARAYECSAHTKKEQTRGVRDPARPPRPHLHLRTTQRARPLALDRPALEAVLVEPRPSTTSAARAGAQARGASTHACWQCVPRHATSASLNSVRQIPHLSTGAPISVRFTRVRPSRTVRRRCTVTRPAGGTLSVSESSRNGSCAVAGAMSSAMRSSSWRIRRRQCSARVGQDHGGVLTS